MAELYVTIMGVNNIANFVNSFKMAVPGIRIVNFVNGLTTASERPHQYSGTLRWAILDLTSFWTTLCFFWRLLEESFFFGSISQLFFDFVFSFLFFLTTFGDFIIFRPLFFTLTFRISTRPFPSYVLRCRSKLSVVTTSIQIVHTMKPSVTITGAQSFR